ncbi:archease [Candidatus Omnitrophota bacterium]
MKKYEIIEHTADIGIKAFGRDVKELFNNAAIGMFEIISNSKDVEAKERMELELEAENIEELFISWLRELLYQFNANLFIFKEFFIREITPTSLKALAWFEPIEKNRHQIDAEIKAVTYHELKIEQRDSGWQAQVIFDV